MATKKKSITTFDEHLTKQYGKRGTVKRTEFEKKSYLMNGQPHS